MKICPICGTGYDDSSVFCNADGATLRTQSDDGELIGSVIADRYLVTGKIGHGGMGSVYLAQHVRLPQQVAIKVLHKSLTFDSDAIARFNREAQHASSISNQHVARIYDFGEVEGMAYLAMEYVEGETLSALLERVGALGPERTAKIVIQIADGLDAAHKLGIVHRDLKPDNILVSTDSDGVDHVKVVDFGIAKATQSTGKSVTQTGLAIGTAEFMSPEQVAGEIVDRRTDVYALGLVSFVMLTGMLPFQGQTKEMSMLMRLTEPPRTLKEIRPDVTWPRGLQEAVSMALSRDVNGRHDSAGEFARDLSAASEPRRATPVRTPTPAHVPAHASTPAEPAGDGGRTRMFVGAAGLAIVVVAGIVFALRPRDNETATVPTPPVTLAANSDSVNRGNTPRGDSAAASGGSTGSGSANVPLRGAAGGGTTGSSGTARGSDTATPPVTRGGAGGRAPGMDSTELRLTLESIARNTDALSITPRSAEQAISDVARVLPHLRARGDSATVELSRIEALISLSRHTEACTHIRALLPRVNPTERRTLQSYQTNLRC